MASTDIGRVKSSKGVTFGVRWDEKTQEVYVVNFRILFSNDVSKCPAKAKSAAAAMRVAEAYLYDK